MSDKNGLFKLWTWRSDGKLTLSQFKNHLKKKNWKIIHEHKEDPEKTFCGIKVKCKTVVMTCRYGL